MLVFDQLKKDDPQLRFLAIIVVLGGFCLLLAGLWWVQLISTSYYRGKVGDAIHPHRPYACRARKDFGSRRPAARGEPAEL